MYEMLVLCAVTGIVCLKSLSQLIVGMPYHGRFCKVKLQLAEHTMKNDEKKTTHFVDNYLLCCQISAFEIMVFIPFI